MRSASSGLGFQPAIASTAWETVKKWSHAPKFVQMFKCYEYAPEHVRRPACSTRKPVSLALGQPTAFLTVSRERELPRITAGLFCRDINVPFVVEELQAEAASCAQLVVVPSSSSNYKVLHGQSRKAGCSFKAHNEVARCCEEGGLSSPPVWRKRTVNVRLSHIKAHVISASARKQAQQQFF
jgi:hypothetical protein